MKIKSNNQSNDHLTTSWVFNNNIYDDTKSFWALSCGHKSSSNKREDNWKVCPECGKPIVSLCDIKFIRFIVTGSSSGIGEAFVNYASTKASPKLQITVEGIDNSEIEPKIKVKNPYFTYRHNVLDLTEVDSWPSLESDNCEFDDYLINNAGVQFVEDPDSLNIPQKVLDTNLVGLMKVTQKYAINNKFIQSVVNLASVSAHNGAEFQTYVASKGGVLAYTKWTAKQLAPRAICNSISFGGVDTPLNKCVTENQKAWDLIMDETPMHKWIDSEEAAKWIWFVAYENRSMTAQDVVIDNGEMYNHQFIWNVD